MESGSREILAFLDQLPALLVKPGCLAINAAIEAAHLGDNGRGFVIVATEVKQLAASTAESAASVAAIEKELHEASRQVETAIGESAGLVRGLAADLHTARDRSAQTREQVRELDRAIGDVAAIAGQQSVSLSSIAGGVDQMARHAQDVAGAAQRAAKLAIGDAPSTACRLRSQPTGWAIRAGPARRAGRPQRGVSRSPRGGGTAARAPRRRPARNPGLDHRDRRLDRTQQLRVARHRRGAELRCTKSSADDQRDRRNRGRRERRRSGVAADARSLAEMRAGFAASVDELQRARARRARARRRAPRRIVRRRHVRRERTGRRDPRSDRHHLQRDDAAFAQRRDRGGARRPRGERLRRHRRRDPRAGRDDLARDAADHGRRHRRHRRADR